MTGAAQNLTRLNIVAFGVPAALMLGALGSEYFGGLVACEMCWWQRYPHIVAVAIAALAFLAPMRTRPLLIAIAAGGILTSGLIGVYHAGVEYKLWPGLTECTRTSHAVSIADLLRTTPLVRCDTPQWTLFGISLAGYNALISVTAAALVFAGLQRRQV